MAAKLGSTDALLYLGAQIADRAYLGTVQVPRVLYFNNAVNTTWTTLGNWWFDAAHTVAATSLPTAADSVVATTSITASGQTVVDFSLIDPTSDEPSFSGTLTVTGEATFSGFSQNNGTINGDATFNDSATNQPQGTINGDATFNDSSGNGGGVTGTVTCNTTGDCP
jgi:hypothetical protein